MIYTVTFNPALDYYVKVDELNLGRVNRANDSEVLFGGKGINVSGVLNNLGIENTALGFIAGFTGSAFEDGLKKQGFNTDFIRLKEGMTRINVKLKSGCETEINGAGPVITAEAIVELFNKLDKLSEGDWLVLSGSIPASVKADIYQQIMARLEDKNIRVVVDAAKDLLMNVLKYKPFLIKPNNFELEEIFGVKFSGADDIMKYAKILQKKGAKNVLVSMAGDGAILVTENGEVLKMGAAKGEVVNSVAAGDSMVAGFIAGYLKSGDYRQALKLGTACGGATAFSKGLCSKAFAEKIFADLQDCKELTQV